jgi:phosphoenolpyruvate synthase/pyruvate phosphate dikinase
METIFTSKANVLKFLSQNLKKSAVESMYDFTVSQWSDNKSEILQSIRKRFYRQRVIVRSSAIGEDSLEKSDAGNYESVLNVPSFSEKRVRDAINSVINSYLKKSNLNASNQILVQKQTEHVVTSGVLFTRTEGVGSPYYTINYENGSSTENVTSGKINNTIKIFRNTARSKIPAKWRFLLESVKEIENTVGSDLLDIEFAITKSKDIVVFQARPLTTVNREQDVPNLEAHIQKSISRSQKRFSCFNKRKHILGDYTIFSDMADWNPAEIIGNNPNELDYSLYDYLIMKSSWHRARTRIGYQDVSPHGLMVRFGNKPYVDTRASFNSLIVNSIPRRIKAKLIDFYLDKLAGNPHLHDKVEFEILFTCYDLTLGKRLEEIPTLTEAERKTVHTRLLRFTNKIIKDFPAISRECESSAAKLTTNREAIQSALEPAKNYHAQLAAAERLLRDCIRRGTIPFSIMARLAFIACILLRSLAKEQNLDPGWVDSILNSVRTPLSEFQEDFTAFCEKRLSKEEFFVKYGHLRPGTYDITALRYDKRKHLFDAAQFSRPETRPGDAPVKEVKTSSLKWSLLECDDVEFLNFVRNSLRQREELKFLFTKNLSDALELIGDAGLNLGFSKSEMAHLSIDKILKSYKRLSRDELVNHWRREIERETVRQSIDNHLVLPPIIESEDDFEIVSYFKAVPNFITNKSVAEKTVYLSSEEEIPALGGMIVLLENADPGYDWIFTRHPAGLITKYGGVASHMSIRCAEIGLPAAIGCGEILFEKLTYADRVLLDCANRQIITLEDRKPDKFMEEKRVLKYLGYIK